MRQLAVWVVALAMIGACSSEDGDSPATGAPTGAGVAGSGATSSGGGSGGLGGSGAAAGSGGHAGGGGVGGIASWPAPSSCDEGTNEPHCGDGQAEAHCPDQLTLFSQTAEDTATGYWTISKPLGGFRIADKYADGEAYLRFEVAQKPTAIEIFPQVCFWRWDPAAECSNRWAVFAETCSSQSDFSYTGPTVSYVSLGAPIDWWQKSSPTWDYSLPFDAMRILQKADHNGTKYLLQDGSCGSACWPVSGGAAAHLPITITAELILVADGATFVTPGHWTGCTESWCN